LFEEQIAFEEAATLAVTEAHGYSQGEAGSYFPSPHAFALGPDDYLEQILRKFGCALGHAASLVRVTV